MNRRPPILTRTGTPFPYTPLCRSLPGHAGDAALATFLGAGLGAGGRIVELDRVRDGRSETGELASVPMWMLDCTQAWVLVPLVHFNTLAGVILLARPPVDRAQIGRAHV